MQIFRGVEERGKKRKEKNSLKFGNCGNKDGLTNLTYKQTGIVISKYFHTLICSHFMVAGQCIGTSVFNHRGRVKEIEKKRDR